MKISRPDLVEAARNVGTTVAAQHVDAVDKGALFPTAAFAALKEKKLLSVYVPKELGGEGCTLQDVTAICHALARSCSSTAMIYAMHQIQVACIVRHGLTDAWHRDFLKELSQKQLLLASATSEAGIGGNVRQSSCFVDRDGARFKLVKNATVVSYGADSDAILITARKDANAASGDQVLCVVKKSDIAMKQTSEWDTLGMRGTRSTGFMIEATAPSESILPVPYADISAVTMLPWAHLTWASLWLGIAGEATHRARLFVRNEARKNPSSTPPGALRAAECMSELQLMRANVADMITTYADGMNDKEMLTALSFAIRLNHVKVATSEMAVRVVNMALRVCGIHGYRNDSPYSVGRLLRDAHSAAIMVSNDRILGNTSSLMLASKDELGL